ncbi:hypothetical protein L6R52_33045 [Myxococcota bacterium]|nr:hypothetical protein [Myxococcota bacterium]
MKLNNFFDSLRHLLPGSSSTEHRAPAAGSALPVRADVAMPVSPGRATLARTGAAPHGASDRSTTSGARTLPSSSPLFLRSASAPDVAVRERADAIETLQKAAHGLHLGQAHQEAITKLFLATSGADLTALKNAVDLGEDQHNMHNLIYRKMDDDGLRGQLLAHFATEAAKTGTVGQFKGLFDVDDTFYASLIDDSYPRGTMYPGAAAYHRELDLGASGGDRLGDNTFLSARPHDPLGISEKLTIGKVRSKGEGPAAVITGDLGHLVGNERIAAKKISNYEEFATIYPEYPKVFEGDSGQGDVLVAIELRSKHPEDVRAAFIHELPNHRTDPEVRAHAERLGVVFFDTRVGQALAAFEQGLISAPGLARVAAAADADFAKVDFGGDVEKAAARRAELDRDIAAAHRALAAAR